MLEFIFSSKRSQFRLLQYYFQLRYLLIVKCVDGLIISFNLKTAKAVEANKSLFYEIN